MVSGEELTKRRHFVSQINRIFPMPKATKKLCEINPQIKILILTRHEDIGYLRTLIEAGASGYILKQSAPGELIRAVQTVVRGKSYLDSSLTERVFNGYVNRSVNLRGENKADITEREQQVLRMTAWATAIRKSASNWRSA